MDSIRRYHRSMSESTTTSTTIPAGTWTLDAAHSTVGFTVRHMMVSKVRGRFSDFTAEIVTTTDPLQSRVDATIQMASIDTGDEGRDGHLRTNDFFDIEEFPTMTFRSTGITGSGSDYQITGDLTIRGVTKPVTFDLEYGGFGKDPWGNTRAGFTLTGTINRKDFGMAYNAVLETGGIMVGEKVSVELDIEATLQA
jgi:polyisoprenoid-binding protein YceI